MNAAAFRPDDFDAINETYFAGLRANGEVFADPSGWRDTFTLAADLLPPLGVDSNALGRYYIDEGGLLAGIKEPIVDLISAWENRQVGWNEVTLIHSVSAATMQVLIALWRRNVRTIVFETPAYAVTMRQAESLGFRIEPVPTYRRENFQTTLGRELITRNSPCAVWITQPRMSLGYDQSIDTVDAILSMISEKDYLVVDEATEQRFPSCLHGLGGSHERMIRLRGVLKGMGLNGLRLAFGLHHEAFRADFENAEEVTGGSLDLFSLETAASLGRDIRRFKSMLDAAVAQIAALHRRAQRLTAGSRVSVSSLVNGYIGCAFIDLTGNDYDLQRRRLLDHCRDSGVPVILGASMRFAFDPATEIVRLNYFNRDRHILDGLRTLVDFTSTLPQ